MKSPFGCFSKRFFAFSIYLCWKVNGKEKQENILGEIVNIMKRTLKYHGAETPEDRSEGQIQRQ